MCECTAIALIELQISNSTSVGKPKTQSLLFSLSADGNRRAKFTWLRHLPVGTWICRSRFFPGILSFFLVSFLVTFLFPLFSSMFLSCYYNTAVIFFVLCMYRSTLPKSNSDNVRWEPEGRYQYSKIFCWRPEGRYCHRYCTVIINLLVLNGTSLNIDSALLALNWHSNNRLSQRSIHALFFIFFLKSHISTIFLSWSYMYFFSPSGFDSMQSWLYIMCLCECVCISVYLSHFLRF